ncbi:MAG: hypothetical protein WCC93_13880, partial [Chthoniobacterales bacterium]
MGARLIRRARYFKHEVTDSRSSPLSWGATRIEGIRWIGRSVRRCRRIAGSPPKNIEVRAGL